MELRDQSADMDTQVDDKVDEMLDEYRSKEFVPVSFVSPKNTNVDAVQFVIKTADIKIPTSAPAPEKEQDNSTFWDRLHNLRPNSR